MNSQSRIYVAGHTGLVGSAIVRMLHWKGYTNILSSPSSYWDLRRQEDVERFFEINEPEYVYLAAAKVGGIGANKDYPGHFIYDNLMIQSNIIHTARKFGVKKLLVSWFFLHLSKDVSTTNQGRIPDDRSSWNLRMMLMQLQRLLVLRCVRHIVNSMDSMLSL